MQYSYDPKALPPPPNCIHCGVKLVWAALSVGVNEEHVTYDCYKCLSYDIESNMIIKYQYKPLIKLVKVTFIIDNIELQVIYDTMTWIRKILPHNNGYRNKVHLDYETLFMSNKIYPIDITSKESITNLIKTLIIFS